jgi:predicted MFS family arabinose efflux permease
LQEESSDPFSGKPWAVAALAYVTAYGWFAVIALPLEIYEYIRAYHVDEWHASVFAGLEVTALAITAFAISPSIGRRNKRALCVGGCLATAAANVLSMLPLPQPEILLTRVLAGVGFGIVVAATNALPVLSTQSARLFALGQVALGVFGASILALLPLAVDPFGLHGLFGFEAATALLTAALSILLPRGILVTKALLRPTSYPRDGKVLGALASIFLFFLAQILVWSFAVQSGTARGIQSAQVDSTLAWSQGVGIFGGLAAIAIGMRWKLRTPLTLGYATTGLLSLLMYIPGSPRTFLVAALVIPFFIIFVTPFILEVLAQLDAEGRVASTGGALINFGSGFAPLVAGGLAHTFGYETIGYVSCGIILLGLALIAPAASPASRAHAVP